MEIGFYFSPNVLYWSLLKQFNGKLQNVVQQDAGQSSMNEVVLCPRLAKIAMPYQVEGIQFLYSNVIVNGSGCILADSMGLGKSFQTICLIDLFMQIASKKVLIVAPVNTIPNWVIWEFNKWLPKNHRQFDVLVVTQRRNITSRSIK